jgi:hypothetical protein
LGRLSLGRQPTVKTGALGHGTRAGAVVASRIPGEEWRGTVVEMAEMHVGGSWGPILGGGERGNLP